MTSWRRDEMSPVSSSDDHQGVSSAAGEGKSSEPDLRRRGDIPTFFGNAACTVKNTSFLANHPDLTKACEQFIKVIGGSGGRDLPPEMLGRTGVELVEHIVTFGGGIAAGIHATVPQLEMSRRARKRQQSLEEGSRPPPARKSRVLHATGETYSQAKILTDDERMAKHWALQREEEALAAASAERLSIRSDLVLEVNKELQGKGIFTAQEVLSGKLPTLNDLKRYIDGTPDDHNDQARQASLGRRQLAFQTYKNRHNLRGKTVKYHYYFDFVHGKGVDHPTVVDDTKPPRDTVIGSKNALAKKVHKSSVMACDSGDDGVGPRGPTPPGMRPAGQV